jgi:hypothetical protein
MANTTPGPQPVHDSLTVGAAADLQLFGDPSLALFGAHGLLSGSSRDSSASVGSLYHGRHRAAE